MEQLNALVERIKKDEDVLAAFLFGSHARGEARPDSDVDVCLVMFPGAFDKVKAFDKRLDLMTDDALDIQIFQSLPLYIRQRVLKDGKVLFCRDQEELLRLACDTVTEFSDFEHIYDDYLKEILHG